MASSHKRRTMAKPGSGNPAARLADAAMQVETRTSEPPISGAPVSKLPVTEAPEGQTEGIDPLAPVEASGGSSTGAATFSARSVGPGATLVDAQVKTLADLCEALDRKCLDLLEDVTAARNAQTVTERELTEARKVHKQELTDIRETHERELAEARRTQAMLERELAALRLVLERANRPGTGSADRPDRQQPDGEAHAARLQPLLEASLAAGTVMAVNDTSGALAQFGAAGMVDSVEGTRDAPACRGWLLSRSDLEVEPLMFLMDDSGLLGWTQGNRERLDVNVAFQNTKPRPGFKAILSRVPVGRLRGIVAVDQADSGGTAFFEASSNAISEDLFPDKGN